MSEFAKSEEEEKAAQEFSAESQAEGEDLGQLEQENAELAKEIIEDPSPDMMDRLNELVDKGKAWGRGKLETAKDIAGVMAANPAKSVVGLGAATFITYGTVKAGAGGAFSTALLSSLMAAGVTIPAVEIDRGWQNFIRKAAAKRERREAEEAAE